MSYARAPICKKTTSELSVSQCITRKVDPFQVALGRLDLVFKNKLKKGKIG